MTPRPSTWPSTSGEDMCSAGENLTSPGFLLGALKITVARRFPLGLGPRRPLATMQNGALCGRLDCSLQPICPLLSGKGIPPMTASESLVLPRFRLLRSLPSRSPAPSPLTGSLSEVAHITPGGAHLGTKSRALWSRSGGDPRRGCARPPRSWPSPSSNSPRPTSKSTSRSTSRSGSFTISLNTGKRPVSGESLQHVLLGGHELFN